MNCITNIIQYLKFKSIANVDGYKPPRAGDSTN